jgi:hypothetical protein
MSYVFMQAFIFIISLEGPFMTHNTFDGWQWSGSFSAVLWFVASQTIRNASPPTICHSRGETSLHPILQTEHPHHAR